MSAESALAEFGLSQRESTIYLSLRQHGLLSIAELTKRTGIPRVSVYSGVEKLLRLGIINRLKKRKRNYFEAQPPSTLLEMLKERFATFERALPLLNSLPSKSFSDFSIQMYEGQTQCRQAQSDYYEFIASKKITLVQSIAHPDLAKTFPRFVPFMIQRRREMGISTHLIVSEEQIKKIPTSYSSSNGRGSREMRMLPKNFPYRCNCLIGGGAVLFILTDRETPSSFLIKSESICQLISALFSFIWVQLQKPKVT